MLLFWRGWDKGYWARESTSVLGAFLDSSQFHNPTVRSKTCLIPFILAWLFSPWWPSTPMVHNFQDALIFYEHVILYLSLEFNSSRLPWSCFPFSLLVPLKSMAFIITRAKVLHVVLYLPWKWNFIWLIHNSRTQNDIHFIFF